MRWLKRVESAISSENIPWLPVDRIVTAAIRKKMKIIVELFLFCLLFTVIVKIAVGNDAVNGLYFYPKAVQEKAFAIGLSDPETMKRKKKRFMIPFFLVMTSSLIVIISVLNGISDFRNAYLQSLLFLEVMNLYDGIVIDRLWVGHDLFWKLKGCEEIPYVQTWAQILKKRMILAAIWIVGAAILSVLILGMKVIL